MSSQLPSQSDVVDPRFAELLKPIKDLTQNWEVPLAELLSDYIDDLQTLTITFDDGKTSVNFAQAALLLQGTAAVYSKKVEFLWQMVMKTLDMLSSKKVGEERDEGESGEVGPRGRKKNSVDMTREFELLVTELGRNIDVKNEEESTESRKNALKFIYVTPRQLIEKEGSEQKSTKVNLYTGVTQGKWDLLAGKEDFRINSQYVAQTGGLGEELNVDNQYLNLVQDDTIPSDSLSSGSLGHDHDVDDAPPFPAGPNQSEHDLSHESVRAAAQSIASPTSECLATAPPTAPASPQNTTPQNTTPEPLFDPWAPLDPYEQVCTPKPMKRGKVTRLPPSLSNKRKSAKHLPPVSEYLIEEMSASLYNPALLPNVAPVFYDLAAQEINRRREREKELRREKIAERPDIRREIFGEEDGQDLHEQYDDYVPDDVADDSPDRFFDFDLPNPHVGGDIGSVVAEDIPIDDEITGDTDSYEGLVARRVAQFVSQSQEFLRSTELARRVANWHEMIGPRLDRVEGRKAFDVHAYGSKILNSFSRSKAIPFSGVVKGLKGEEVARYFLSTLMLANTENVEISTAPGSDLQMGMDNVMLTLLSTTRHHHQLAEFQAVSQSGEWGDSGIGERTARSDSESPTTSAGSSPVDVHDARQKQKRSGVEASNNATDDREEEFRVPDPPRSKKGRGKKT